MRLKLKVDENLPAEAAQMLRVAGRDAVTTLDQRLGGHPDEEMADVCQREDRIILTLDGDFGDIRTYVPAEYPGIIVLNLVLLDKRPILTAIRRLLPVLSTEVIAGKLWIVDEWRVRVHG